MPPTPKLSAQQCPQCSAPLEIGKADTSVKCHYCGNTISVERAKAPDPAVQQARHHTVYIDSRAGRVVSRILWVSFAIPVLGPLLVTLGTWVVRRPKSAAGANFPAPCGLNDELEISGATFTGPGTL